MAKNDTVLIDGIIDERILQRLPSDQLGEAFEYFVFEQSLKDFDLSLDELQSGIVDGRDDGGIDGFYILINGHLLNDPETFNWPKTGALLEVWIITCKYHDTFRQAPLDSLAASIVELFDFTLVNDALVGSYSEKVKRQRENLKYAYRKVSPRLTQFNINFCYGSRGDALSVGESIIARAKQISQLAQDSFNNCASNFKFLGATELIQLYRKAPNFTLEIPFIEDLSSGQTYILLVRLKDYYQFIQDEGKLRRYLFDSNVRDYMGLNRVNEDIKATLDNSDSPDFWWLNNGVTILATGASVIGKSIQIQDIQIVNGLQTSESIYRYFKSGQNDTKDRSVLVKVIVSQDEEVRDAIIRATNNQTAVELASLHATDKIQRDIEDILRPQDFFYERRANYYKNQGISTEKIVTPLYLAAAYVNLILKSPAQASVLKSRFMRSDSSYSKVFSDNGELNLWPKLAFLLKKTDFFLESVRPNRTEHFLKGRRQILSFLTVSKLLGTYDYSNTQLLKLDLSLFTEEALLAVWNFMTKTNSFPLINKKIKSSDLDQLFGSACVEWNLLGLDRILKGKKYTLDSLKTLKEDRQKTRVTKEFAMKVNGLLKPQPWKPGMHHSICLELNCTKSEYFDAVQLLIEEGLWYHQKDGVVYDSEGNVLTFDAERIDQDTMRLKDNNINEELE